MYSVSSAFNTAISQHERTLRIKAITGGLTIDDFDIESFNLNESIISGQDFKIGCAVSSDFELKVSNIGSKYIATNFTNFQMSIEIGVKIADGSFEYVPLGKFNMDKMTRDKQSFTVSGNDNMIKFERTWTSGLTFPATLGQILAEVCDICNVPLATTSFTNSSISTVKYKEQISCRQAVQNIAEAAGGFARINRTGQLEIINLEAIEKFAYNGDNTFSITKSDIQIGPINNVQMNFEDTIANRGTFTDNTKSVIIKDNSFIQTPESEIDAIYNKLVGIAYLPFTANTQCNPAVQAGDYVKVTDYLGDSFGYVTGLKITYTGDLKSEITSCGRSDTAITFDRKSTTADKVADNADKVEKMAADVNLFKDSTALTEEQLQTTSEQIVNLQNTVDGIGDLTAGIANIQTLNADMANINTLKADTAYVNNLFAKTATIDNLIATNALITNLQADTANIKTLKADVAVVNDLSANVAKINDLTATKANIADLTAANAKIDTLTATKATITDLNATKATIEALTATNGVITNLQSAVADINTLTASKATISELNATNARVDTLNTNVANINTAAITTARIADAAITTAKIGTAQITTANIADASISTAKIIDANITGAKIATATIDSANIKNAAITTALINDASISTAKIQDASINTAKIANGAITSANIAFGAIDTAHIKTGTITAANIALGTITDANILNASITNAKIANLSVDTFKIADLAVTGAKIAAATIDSANIKDAAITTAKIGTAQITDAKIVNGTITNASIKDATITGAKIALATIDSAQIKDAAITNAKIGTAAIKTANIAVGNITTALIADAQITAAKIVDGSITTAKIGLAQITEANIQNASIGTATIKVGAITNALIGNQAVGTAQIADGSITDAKVVSLSASKITAGTIDAAKINVINLTADSLTVGSINGNKLVDGSVTGLKIIDGTLTNAKIADNTITGSKLVTDSITSREIASKTITANEILAGTITSASGIIANLDAAVIQTGKINSEHLNITGAVSFGNLNSEISNNFSIANGRTYIDGGSIATQSITAKSINANGLVILDSTEGNNASFIVSQQGEVQIAGSMNSFNYSDTLNTGWKISKNGDAVFNNATVRGAVLLPHAGMSDASNIRIWAGSNDPTSAPFTVDNDGNVTATKVSLHGQITGNLNSGNIKISDNDPNLAGAVATIAINTDGDSENKVLISEQAASFNVPVTIGNGANNFVRMDTTTNIFSLTGTEVDIFPMTNNLLNNTAFAYDTAGWTLTNGMNSSFSSNVDSTVTYDTVDTYNGKNSIKIATVPFNGVNPTAGKFSQTINPFFFNLGETLTLSYMAECFFSTNTAGNPYNGAKTIITFEYYNVVGTKLTQTDSFAQTFMNEKTWTPFSFSFVPPANTSSVKVTFTGNSVSPYYNATMAYSNIQLERGTKATAWTSSDAEAKKIVFPNDPNRSIVEFNNNSYNINSINNSLIFGSNGNSTDADFIFKKLNTTYANGSKGSANVRFEGNVNITNVLSMGKVNIQTVLDTTAGGYTNNGINFGFI